MLRNAFTFLTLAISLLAMGGQGLASEVTYTDCQRSGPEANCRIFLQGTVQPGELLFVSRVHDRDTLTYQGHTLGSTGSFLGRAFHAGFFPRVYSLAPIQGSETPILNLHVEGGLLHPAGLPAGTQVKVIDEKFPLWKILGPAAVELMSFAFLLNLCFYLLLWLRQRNADGWLYPRDELRWFVGSLCAFLLLRHEVAELCVPLLWSPRTHLFTQRAALLVALWSATMLLLGGRFSDRSSIERAPPSPAAKTYFWLAHAAFAAAIAFVAYAPLAGEARFDVVLALPLTALILAQERALRTMEWRRVLKRSGKSSLLFHVGLIGFPCAVLVTVGGSWLTGAGDQRFLEGAGWGALLLAGLRMRSQHRARERSRALAVECRTFLKEFPDSSRRLQALCDFIADEWGAARVSVISVDDEVGFVLNSAGPEAIPEEGRAEPRRLGPFLRRVCKQGQMLYAPVVEELGQDLQSQGLKHSSLAIPLRQDHAVRAVLCMMADEGERIPPTSAAQLELLSETLSLEILSAVAQSVAESRNSRLLEIARTADALAIENLDHWGHAQPALDTSARVVLGGDSIPAGPFLDLLKRSAVFGRVLAAYRQETRATWTALAAAFEFTPKDNREDFWVISPRDFQNPLLRRLGPERTAALLTTLLERHARNIASKPVYAVLGFCGVRLVTGSVSLRRSGWHGSAVEIDSDEFSLFLDLRSRAAPGSILFTGDAASLSPTESFTAGIRPWEGEAPRQILSILHAAADKKEVRRLENQALEKARGLPRKTA